MTKKIIQKPEHVPSTQEEWLEFNKNCYPYGMHVDQARQLKQAFFAGAVSMFFRMQEASVLEEDEAMKILEKFQQEFNAYFEELNKLNEQSAG